MHPTLNHIARSAKQLGIAIQQRRIERGMTQTDLAAFVGTGQKTISKIENGNAATRVDTIFSILAILGLELDVRQRQSTDENYEDLI